MIYPTLHLHRTLAGPTDAEAETVDYFLQPARIIDFEAVKSGGSKLTIENLSRDEFGYSVYVNESPDMIRLGILEAITQCAAASTKGAIQMNLAAQKSMQDQNDRKIIEARGGIPPFNGG